MNSVSQAKLTGPLLERHSLKVFTLATRYLPLAIVLKDTENPYQPCAAWRESYSLSSEVFQFEIKCLVHTLPNETAQLRSDIDVTVWFHWNDAK